MKPSRGFALMMAVFLIVVLATIGLYVLTTATGQSAAALQDEQAARAYQAARAGLEAGAYEILRVGNGAPCTTADQTISFTSQGLSNFTVKYRCARVNAAGETEGGTEIFVYEVTSTGCNAGACPGTPSPAYVERQLQITIARGP